MLTKMTNLIAIVLAIFTGYSLAFAGNNRLINSDAEIHTTQGWTDPDDAWSSDNERTPHTGNYFFWPARRSIEKQ